MDATALYQQVKAALGEDSTHVELSTLLSQVLDLDEQTFRTAPVPGQSWANLGARLAKKIHEP